MVLGSRRHNRPDAVAKRRNVISRRSSLATRARRLRTFLGGAEAMTPAVIGEFRDAYGGQVPDELIAVLGAVIPTGEGFPDFLDPAGERQRTLERVLDGYLFDAEHGYWPDGFGPLPPDRAAREELVRARIQSAPPLIRIHSHRFVPALDGPSWPVLSLYSPSDTVIIAHDVLDYFEWMMARAEGRTSGSREPDWERFVPFWMESLDW